MARLSLVATMFEPIGDEPADREAKRLRHGLRRTAEAAGEVDLDPGRKADGRGRRRIDDKSRDITPGLQAIMAGREDDVLAAFPGNPDLSDRPHGMQGQRHGQVPRPGMKREAPALLDQGKARLPLHRDTAGDDKGLDEGVLIRSVEAQMGLHLGERDRLDGWADESYRVHAMSPETIDLLRGSALRLVLGALLALVPRAAGAIVGGTADPAASRSAVMVLNSRGGVCSGVVIAPDVVLTAAHCASGASDHRVHFRAADGSSALLEPVAIIRHPGYSAGAETTRRRSIDLALVRLPSNLPGTFAPATLSTATAQKGARVTVGGYGVAREGDGRSSGTYRTAGMPVVEPYGPGKILLWLADPDGSSGACQGDSGGSVTNGAGAVVAVTSWARGKGAKQCGELTQGVLVAPQRAWIDSTLSRWGRSAAWN